MGVVSQIYKTLPTLAGLPACACVPGCALGGLEEDFNDRVHFPPRTDQPPDHVCHNCMGWRGRAAYGRVDLSPHRCIFVLPLRGNGFGVLTDRRRRRRRRRRVEWNEGNSASCFLDGRRSPISAIWNR